MPQVLVWMISRGLLSVFMLGAFGIAYAGGQGGFGQPEVIKLDWSTRSLKSGFLNQDDRVDLVAINNEDAKIELLYQRNGTASAGKTKRIIGRDRWDPDLEDALFDKQGITVGFTMFDLVIGDFNRDGLSDLAYTGREQPLTIRLQGADGSWRETLEFEGFEALGWVNTMAAKDLNGDGELELIVLEADSIRIYTADEDGRILEPKVYHTTGDNAFNLMIQDVTGDGLHDILYLNNDGVQSLALRKQLSNGAFGPEQRHEMDRSARTIHVMESRIDVGAHLVAVDSRSGFLDFLEFQEDTTSDSRLSFFGQPDVYPVPDSSSNGGKYALGDMDGDGDSDLIFASSDRAEVLFFEYKKGHFQQPLSFPSFSSISSLSAGRFFNHARDGAIVLSQEEKTLGFSSMSASGRLQFPASVIDLEGEPVVASAIDFDADGVDELALIVADEEGDYLLQLLRPIQRQSIDFGWEPFFSLPITEIRRAPSSIVPLDLYAGEGLGVMITIPRKAPILLAPGEGEALLKEVAVDSNLRESFLNGITPAAVSVFDVDADGANELVVGRSGYARALRFEDDELVMVDQFNAAEGDSVVDAVVPVYGSEGLERIALYIGSEGEIQYLERQDDGVFRFHRTDRVGPMELTLWKHLNGDAQSEGFVFAGRDRFWVFGPTADRFSWESVRTYETDLDEIHFSHAASGDFDADGKLEVLAIDGTNHLGELISDVGDVWVSRMYWEIFEANMHYQGRQGAKLEPRQILVDDLNADGRLDFAFLVHDRVLIYPGLSGQ